MFHMRSQEGEQCYLLFDPSEKDRLPSIMLDQARVAAELRDCEVLGTELGRSAACTSDRDGSHCSDQVREVEHLRSTVSEQQSEIERLRSELVRVVNHSPPGPTLVTSS